VRRAALASFPYARVLGTFNDWEDFVQCVAAISVDPSAVPPLRISGLLMLEGAGNCWSVSPPSLIHLVFRTVEQVLTGECDLGLAILAGRCLAACSRIRVRDLAPFE
jgi:hypothetical protein